MAKRFNGTPTYLFVVNRFDINYQCRFYEKSSKVFHKHPLIYLHQLIYKENRTDVHNKKIRLTSTNNARSYMP